MSLRQIMPVVFAAILLLGCVGSGSIDAVSAAKTSSQIQTFLQAHPNAKIVVLLQSGDGLAKALNQVPECASVTSKSAYQVTFADNSTNAVSFISPDNGQVLCAVVNSNGQALTATGSTGGAPSTSTRPPSTPSNEAASTSSSSSAGTQTSAQNSDEALVQYQSDAQGYKIQKPASWQADIQNDQYLLVKKDDDTDALIWPIQLQGKYVQMTGVDLGNYIIGLIKNQYADFNAVSISTAPDKTKMEVVATMTVDGVKLKGVLTTFVDANGHGLLAGYEAPVDQFDQEEPTLRKIIASYQLVSTDATKAAVGPAPTTAVSGGTGGTTTSIQLEPFTASDGSFSFQAPAGWRIDGLGQCSTRSMAAYDPNNPIRRLFYIDSNTIALPASKMTAEAVLLEDLPMLGQYESAYSSPTNIQIVGPKTPIPGITANPSFIEGSTLDATMTIDGKPAKGHFGVAINAPGGAAAGVGYIFFQGEIVEDSAFDASRPALDQAILSFNVDKNYIQQCSANTQADITRRTGDISKTLSDTSDIITSGYNARSQVQDRIAQKWSDTTLGVDRVYDPSADQVYQVPNNFYENYDLNRQKFEKSDLQQLTPDQWTKYAPLDGNLNIH